MFLLFLLLFTQSVFADYLSRDQCATRDLSSQFGPVHNQLDHGWCWGFAAQDLMSFAAGRMDDPYSTQDVVATTLTTPPENLAKYADRQDGFDEKSQAVHAASLQKLTWSTQRGKKPSLRAGGIHQAVAAYSARGEYCTMRESKLSQPDASVVAKRQVPQLLLDHVSKASLSLVPKSLRAMKKAPEPVSKSLTTKQIQFGELLPQCDPPEFAASRFLNMRAALNDKAVEDFKKTIDASCQSRKTGPEFVPKTRTYEEPAFFDNRTNSDLAESLKNGIPVGIAYNAAFLLKNSKPDDEYGHASIVVGLRWNEKEETCEFKIQNSWGTNCSTYPAEYATAENCDNGNVWVKERDVLLNVWSSTTVRKK